MVSFNTSFLDTPETLGTGPESTGVRHHGHGHQHLSLTLAHILLALWTWLANVTQIVNLLLDGKLRRQPRSALIISISVSELLVAAFLCPLYTDSLVRGPWRHGPLLCSMYEVVFYLQVCVSCLAVLVFNVERFYFMAAPRMLQAPSRHHITALLTSLPWLVGVVVVVPLFVQGTQTTMEHVPGLHHRTCVVQWDRTMHIVTMFITFLGPSFLLLATAVTVLLLYTMFSVPANEMASLEPGTSSVQTDHQWARHTEAETESRGGRSRRRRRRHFSGLQELDTKLKRECVISVCVSTFISVGLQCPIFALLLLQQFCQPPAHHPAASESSAIALLPESSPDFSSPHNSCQFSDTAWATCMLLGMAKPGLMPLVWLVYRDIRAGFSPKACGLCWWRCWKPWRARSARHQNYEHPAESAAYRTTPSQPSLASQMTLV